MALIPPFFLDCVVAVGAPSPSGVRWIGTGFLYMRVRERSDEEATGRVFLVTNKHVVEGRVDALIRCNPEGEEPAKEYGVDLLREDKTPAWMGHPDPAIDVAVLPINFDMLRQQGMQVGVFCNDAHVLTCSEMADHEVSEGDATFVLGFPMAMVGESRNFVIVRGGTLARIRDCIQGANPEFLVDASVFPGNSGGPVVLAPEAMAITGTKSLNAAYLVGIVKAYVPYQDVAVSQQTQRPRVIFEENTGLAAAHPVDAIERAIDEAISRERDNGPTLAEQTETVAAD